MKEKIFCKYSKDRKRLILTYKNQRWNKIMVKLKKFSYDPEFIYEIDYYENTKNKILNFKFNSVSYNKENHTFIFTYYLRDKRTKKLKLTKKVDKQLEVLDVDIIQIYIRNMKTDKLKAVS